MPRRKAETQLSDTALTDYTDFRYSLNSLLDPDRGDLTEHFATVSARKWYTRALKAVYSVAYDSGRLQRGEIVTGAPDDLAALADIAPIAGGAAMDIAVAVLVRDLVDPDDYRKVTSWWAKTTEAAWLPTEPQLTPQPEPMPLPENLPRRSRPGTVINGTVLAEGPPDTAPERPAPARPAGRPTHTGAHLPPITAPVPPRPRTPEPAKRPDPEQIRRQLAAEKRKIKLARRRRVATFNIIGLACLALWVLALFFAAFDAAGGEMLPLGEWFGTGRSALIWLILAAVNAVASAICFRRAKTARTESR
jgi:hypothetical protein